MSYIIYADSFKENNFGHFKDNQKKGNYLSKRRLETDLSVYESYKTLDDDILNEINLLRADATSLIPTLEAM